MLSGNAVVQRPMDVGDLLQVQGRLLEAQDGFKVDLEISERLAVQDPSNADWQHGLSVAHRRVGDLLQAQGKFPEAQTAFLKTLAINIRLMERDPTNADW